MTYGIMNMEVKIMLRLKDLREDKDLLQKDIANILNTTREQYCRYELGIRYLPINHLVTLAFFYQTSTDYILGLSNKFTSYNKNKEYNLKIEELRKENNLTQKDLAKILKTTQEQYSKYESNIRKTPIYHLITLAEYYNTSVDYILGLVNIKNPYPKNNNCVK